MHRVLLLTATVRPPADVPVLQRSDPAIRLQDYASALSFYLGLVGTTFDRIVFVENSRADLGTLKALAASSPVASQVEFLSFDGLDYPASHGRGYGEFKLVDHAMAHAGFLAGDVVVWKCTGRYVVRNIDALVRERPAVGVYCHLRDFPVRLCELYLMSFTRHGHEAAIRGAYRFLRNDAVPGVHSNEEVAFRLLVDAWPPEVTVARRFSQTPHVEGVRGWNNRRYGGKHSPKTVIRRMARVVAPWLWI